jgi:hypothetical protein
MTAFVFGSAHIVDHDLNPPRGRSAQDTGSPKVGKIPAEVGDYSCSPIGGLRVRVMVILATTATIIIAAQPILIPALQVWTRWSPVR